MYSGLTWNSATFARSGPGWRSRSATPAPVAGGVVGPATAIGLGQGVRAKTGVDEAGQRHAAELVAHRHKAQLGGEVFGKQRALVAELRQLPPAFSWIGRLPTRSSPWPHGH